MGRFEQFRRDLRRALCLTALAIPLGSLAQPVPCSRLPEAEQAQARQQGLCVDDTTAAAKKTPVLTPQGAARAAAATGKTAAATAATSVKGARPRFECARLPDFVASRATYEQAVRALPRGLFRPRIARHSPSSAPAEVVIAQSTEPLDGNLCWATFVLSDGSLVGVPLVRGLTRALAMPRLQAAGLRMDARDQPSDAAAPGSVFEQRPEANAEVPRGSMVQVAIALATTIGVPDVVGQNLGEARAMLSRFAVDARQKESVQPAGKVLAQLPPGGSEARPGSAVGLTVSDGSIVTVPPLHGATLADARAALQRAGDLNAATPNGDEPGTMLVDISSPAAGLRVRRGSTVALTLVPLTPWRTWASAIATLLLLGGAGLYKWRQRKPSPSAPHGVAVQFGPSIEFNIRPIEARAGGPEVPAIGLRAEFVRGGAWAEQDNNDEESTS